MEKYKENKSCLSNCRDSLHLRCGPIYKNDQLQQAVNNTNKNELRAIYHLTETLVPGLRERVVYRSFRQSDKENWQTLDKKFMEFNCNDTKINDKISCMLKNIGELPKEWQVIQITPQFNLQESIKTKSAVHNTTALNICVFNCGQTEEKPIHITTDLPKKDNCDTVLNIMQEQTNIVNDINNHFSELTYIPKSKTTRVNKQYYIDLKNDLGCRLQQLLKQIEDSWLREWKCLFVGKFVDDNIEKDIREEVLNIIEENKLSNCDTRMKIILYHLIKGFSCLYSKDAKSLLSMICPDDKTARINIYRRLQKNSTKYNFQHLETYPVILILDEKLDTIPWELTSMLDKKLVTRMPSLHFAYGLYKEHEKSIKNGYKLIKTANNGKYIINPGLDLLDMEKRLCLFFKYWTSNWSGIVGKAPTAEEFKSVLTESDIFLYSGHGSGVQYLPGEKIERLRVNAVALLFGCKSAALSTIGPTVEAISTHYTYLIGCSPCVLGMLYNVTDFDTDCITAAFLSQIIVPSKPTIHWKYIDKVKWHRGDIITTLGKTSVPKYTQAETDLLKAFLYAKNEAQYYLTKAACVSRGLPVKVCN